MNKAVLVGLLPLCLVLAVATAAVGACNVAANVKPVVVDGVNGTWVKNEAASLKGNRYTARERFEVADRVPRLYRFTSFTRHREPQLHLLQCILTRTPI